MDWPGIELSNLEAVYSTLPQSASFSLREFADDPSSTGTLIFRAF